MPTKKSGGGRKTVTNHRDSGTGQFVTEKYTKTHPKTTETEHNPRHPRGGGKKK